METINRGQRGFSIGDILANCFAGIVSGLMTLIASISYATLIFSGNLSGGLHLGVCSALVSASAVGCIVALRSSSTFVIAGPDANISAILALMVASVSAGLAKGPSGSVYLSTIWVLISLSSFLAGIFFYLIGKFHLGRWIRFIPYPVVGGFLAGTGWLLVRGAFKVMGGIPLTLTGIPSLIRTANMVHWLPGVILAISFVAILRRFKHFLVMPSLLVGAIALAHAGIFCSGMSLEEARVSQWLLEDLPGNLLGESFGSLSLGAIDWSLMGGESGNFVALMLLAAVVILLNAASVEIATRSDVDLDRELKSTGWANIVGAPLGGLVGCIALSRTLLNWRAGATGRLSGVVAALISAAILFFGSSILSYIPRPVLGALLLYLGLNLLVEWVYEGWFKFSRFDFFLVVSILVVIAAEGFLPGVSIGLIAACMLFAFNYSRVSVIKNELSGAGFRSKVERAFHEQKILKEKGHQIYILRLQGYIFFGTAYPLLNHIRERLLSGDGSPVRFVLIDFSRVSGLDSSSVLSFSKILQTCEATGARLVFVNLDLRIRAHLEEGGSINLACSDRTTADPENGCQLFSDLDHAVAWCEEKILRDEAKKRRSVAPSLEDLFGELFQGREAIADLRAYLERLEKPKGYVLFRQGQISEDLFFVESGEVTALLELPNGKNTRLRTMGAGTVIGEMGLYLGRPRSGTIVTERPSVLFRLSSESFNKMKRENLQLASSIHEFMVRLLANRLTHANEELVNMMG